MAALLLTNNPAPMIPPMEIMAMWRGFSERLSSDIMNLWDGVTMPPEAARAVSRSTEDNWLRISSSVQRLVGAEILMAATGRPSGPSTGAAIVRSPR